MYHSISPKSVSDLTVIKRQIEKSKNEYAEIKTKFIRPFGVVYLDQIMRTLRKSKDILLMPRERNIHQYLEQCGFNFLYGTCKSPVKFDETHIIKLKRFENSLNIEDEFVIWIDEELIKYFPNIKIKLKKKIIENLWEVVYNAIIHGESEFGISACGQFYPRKNYFEFAFYDPGIGISNKVSNYLKADKDKTDADFIEWALQEGNSTLNKPNAGMGLFFLRKFVYVNKGSFQIFSGNGCFGHLEFEDETKKLLTHPIDGTLLNIRINLHDNK